MWFRVTIRKDGSLVSCEPVEVALQNGVAVFYVDALDVADAIRLVKKEYAHKYEARLKAEGLCRECGGKAYGRARCEGCAAVKKKSEATRKDRGLCLNCNNPCAGASRMCEHHLAYGAAKTAARRAAAKVPHKERDKVYAETFAKLKPAKQPGTKVKHMGMRPKLHTERIRLRILKSALVEYEKRNGRGFREWLLEQIKDIEVRAEKRAQKAAA